MTKITTAGIGHGVVRKEDDALVRGHGRFSDDIDLAGQAYAAMVRSPHAHARIHAIDRSAAMTVPGVLAVLTGADALADGLKPIPHRPIIGPPDIALGSRDASDKFVSPHRVLPHDKARFAGEAVAMVIAESVIAAKDAAERVRVDFEPLPAVTDTVAAAAPEAPRLWDDAGSNVCVDAQVGDAAATAAAFARAAISAPATRSIPSSRSPPGPRAASAARSNGPASGRKPFSATIRAATSSSARSLRSIEREISWRCAAPRSAT